MPSKRRWVPKETWDAYVARGELVGRPTPRWSSDEVVRLRTLVGDDGELGEKEWKTIAERLRKDVEGRSGHAYALVKPKAGGGRRDFEFANYPAFLIVARD